MRNHDDGCGCNVCCVRGPRGCDGPTGPAGTEGPAGRRGVTGATGPIGPMGLPGTTGATGPAAPTFNGVLKFSGVAEPGGQPAEESFLADWGTGRGIDAILNLSPDYPVAVPLNLRNMAVNLLGGFVVPLLSQLTITLRKNGSPQFSITYGPFESGVKTVIAGPVTYMIGDRFDIQLLSSLPEPVSLSVTIGVD